MADSSISLVFRNRWKQRQTERLTVDYNITLTLVLRADSGSALDVARETPPVGGVGVEEEEFSLLGAVTQQQLLKTWKILCLS
jgi:hypothetical protein